MPKDKRCKKCKKVHKRSGDICLHCLIHDEDFFPMWTNAAEKERIFRETTDICKDIIDQVNRDHSY